MLKITSSSPVFAVREETDRSSVIDDQRCINEAPISNRCYSEFVQIRSIRNIETPNSADAQRIAGGSSATCCQKTTGKKTSRRTTPRFLLANTTPVAILRAQSAFCDNCIECTHRKMNWQRNCFQKAKVVVPSDKRNLLFGKCFETTPCFRALQSKKFHNSRG